MAGNANSGNGIAFRLSEKQLQEKMEKFRKEFGKGQNGMVTWELFCGFLGYSVDEVRECVARGEERQCAYTERGKMLRRFYDEVRAMMFVTADQRQTLATNLAKVNLLDPPEAKDNSPRQIVVMFGTYGDPRLEDARS